MKWIFFLAGVALLGCPGLKAVDRPSQSVPVSTFKVWRPDGCLHDGSIFLAGLRLPGDGTVVVAQVDPETLQLKARSILSSSIVFPVPKLLCDDPKTLYVAAGNGVYRIEKGLKLQPTQALYPIATSLGEAAAYGDTIAIAWTVPKRSMTSHIRVYEKEKLVCDVDFGNVIRAMALVPERSLLYFRDDSHLGVLNYRTGHAHFLMDDDSLYGRSGRCGRLIVFGTPDHRRQDDLLIVDPDTGTQKFLSARGYDLGFVACSSRGIVYAAGSKSWYNFLTEGYHTTDARLFRYDPATGEMVKSSRSILHDPATGGLFAMDDQRAYEFVGSQDHYPELVERILREEPRSALEALFSQ